jgi:hypothetical protein
MVGPLLMRSVFFFSRGVEADVLRNFFSAENVLRQQVEAEIKEILITRLQSRSRERNGKRRLLLNGSLLWWEAVLLAWCFPLVRHGFGGFFWKRKTRGNEMMKVCTSGFVEHRRAILLAVEIHRV